MPMIGATRVQSGNGTLWTSVNGNREANEIALTGNNPQNLAQLCQKGAYYTLAYQGGRRKGCFLTADAHTASFRDMGPA